jgi:hypothetical protein
MGGEYRHTQVGTLTIVIIALAAILTAFALYSASKAAEGDEVTVVKLTGLAVVGVFAFVLASFYAFTIEIVDGELRFWFGWGVARRSVPSEEIRSVEVVRVPWYYFWGIKSISGGWLYSIAPGGRAIELVLKDGRKILLGTDRPEEIKLRLDEVGLERR